MGGGHVTQTTRVLEDAAARVSRYLLMQLVVNASLGALVALGLYLIGVPNAVAQFETTGQGPTGWLGPQWAALIVAALAGVR